jgi:hypothetical protein
LPSAFAALAGFVMRGFPQAVALVALLALLSLFFPPLFYLSGAAVALVTLRQGWGEGLQVLVAALLAVALVFELGFGKAVVSLVFLATMWGPVWGVSALLRWTRRFSLSVLAAAGAALLLALALLWLQPKQLSAFWLQVFQLLQVKVRTSGDAGATPEAAARLLHALSWVATGISMGGLLFSWLSTLFLGRWWQGLLYNPGGFGAEFSALHLGRGPGVVAVLLLGLLLFADGASKLLGLALLPIVAVPLFMSGIALAHWLRERFDAPRGWLTAMYLVLILALLAGLPMVPAGLRAVSLPSQVLVLGLVVVGFLDCWFHFRRRLGERGNA